jgi:2'-5' RNA ligase
METIRAFIAIELSAALQKALGEVISTLSPHTAAVRWIAPENIHLTLKFLGDIPTGNLALLQKAIQAEALQHPACSLAVGGLGAFPSLRRPRVIWIGIQAPSGLKSLHQGLENAASRMGIAREERPFSPHLTLGRINQRATPAQIDQLGTLLGQVPASQLGEMKAETVTLYRSDLKPGGAVYTRIIQARLKI